MANLTTKLPWDQAQPRWASQLNPFLALPILNGILLKEIKLTANKPQAINHLLQRMPQGWMLVDNTENAVVWRTQDFNVLIITLEANADTQISLWVF